MMTLAGTLACTTTGPAAEPPAPVTHEMPAALRDAYAAGLSVCTGQLSGRRALGPGLTEICVADDNRVRRVWFRRRADDDTAIDIALPGEVTRTFDADGGVRYQTELDANALPAQTRRSLLASSTGPVRLELQLTQRHIIRSEGALSQHFVGRLALASVTPQSERVVDGLHFYSIEHDPSLHWGYSGENGPEHWGQLEAADEACAVDRPAPRQSPVFLRVADAAACDPGSGPTQLHYRPGRVSQVNNGHTVMASVLATGEEVDAERASYIVADKVRYDLLQFHFHVPAEHMIDEPLAGKGHSYPLEIHFVHRSEAGALAVVAVFAERSGVCATSTLVDGLLKQFPQTLNVPREYDGELNPIELMPRPDRRRVYNYEGSLTTPPCTEGVHWFVMQSPIGVTDNELDQISSVIGGHNARRLPKLTPPVPPLLDREVRLCDGPRGKPVRQAG